MLRYAAGRLLAAVPLLLGLTVLSFFYVHVLPGDPVSAMLGVNTDPALVAQLRHQFGLDQPLVKQFWSWLDGLARGNLGVSFRSQLPVFDLIRGRVPAAAELGLGGLVVMVVFGVGGGLIAGIHRGHRVDALINSVAIIGLGIPGFFVGVLLIAVLSLKLHVLPSGGYTPFTADPAANLRALVMPALTLGASGAPFLARLSRSAVLTVLESEYVSYGRSKGLGEVQLSIRYVLRNAMPQLVAAIGLSVGALLGGSVIVEQLFVWPGTGQLILAAVNERDYAMIQAVILLYGGIFILVNLLAELVQGLLDPRIRFQ